MRGIGADPRGHRPAAHHPQPTEEDQQRMLELYSQGLSTRQVGKEVGFSHNTIARYLRKMGADTKREVTATATAARMRQMAQRRITIAEELLDTVEGVQDRLWDTYESYMPSPDGPQLIKMDEPPIKDQADGIKAIEAAISSVDRLLAGADNPETDEAKDVLTNIEDGLKAIFHGAGATAGLDVDDKDYGYDIHEDPDQKVDERPEDSNNPEDWEYEEYDDFYVPGNEL